MANQYPCRTILTDNEFLCHMIPHHQMAINISKQHDKYTHNDIIKSLIRDLIRTQSYEIVLMQIQLKKKIDNISIITKKNSISFTTISNSLPNTYQLTNTYCDPNFFNMNHQKEIHMNHTFTDEMYIKHMIPHHQVAIDMCKIIIKNTKNDFIMSLAYDMLKNQEAEVFLLNNLKKSNNIPNQLSYY